MGKLFRFEFRKLFRTKAFYVCTIIATLPISLFAILTKFGNGLLYVQAALTTTSMFPVFLGIYMANFVCMDQANDTLKNVYAKGYDRNKIYAAKYIVSLVGAIIMTAVCLLMAYLSGKMFETVTITPSNDYVLTVLVQFLGVVAYHALYFIVSNSIGRTGGAVAINIAGPSFVTLLLNIIDTTIASKGINFTVSPYWISSTLTVNSDTLLRSFIVALVYIVVFLVIGFFLNRRKETK